MPQFSADNEDELRKKLQDAAKQNNVQYDESDLQGMKHRDYSDQSLQSTLDRYGQRASNNAGPSGNGSQGVQQQSMPSVGSPPPAYSPNAMPNLHMQAYQPSQFKQFNAPQHPGIAGGGYGAAMGGNTGIAGGMNLPNSQVPQGGAMGGAMHQNPDGSFSSVPLGGPQMVGEGRNGGAIGPGQQGPPGLEGLISQLVNNPHSMNDQAVNQMKEKQKEDAVAMQQAQMAQMQQSAASRGTANGGYLASQQARGMDSLIGSVLNSNRQTDLYKAEHDRSDELNAAQAGDAYLNNDLQRAINGYQTGLGGQQAQANENFRGNESANQGTQFDMANFFNNEQLRQAASNSQFQGWNAQTGFGLQQMAQQLAQQQFNANMQYQYQRDANNMNFNYANLYSK